MTENELIEFMTWLIADTDSPGMNDYCAGIHYTVGALAAHISIKNYNGSRDETQRILDQVRKGVENWKTSK